MSRQGSLEVFPIRSERKDKKFPLGKTIETCIASEGLTLKQNDILVVSSKFAAMAEGRYTRLDSVKASKAALKLSERYQLNPGLSELIVRESDKMYGGIPGYVLASSQGILAPNAGIDRSNVGDGYAILYPKDASRACSKLWIYLVNSRNKVNRSGKNLGVILSDSRVMPGRFGTTGVAIASAGFEPVIDCRGKKDLFGNELKVTVRAIADQIASAAELVMGEADESTPIALVRGWQGKFAEGEFPLSTQIPIDKDLYVSGLRNFFENKSEKQC